MLSRAEVKTKIEGGADCEYIERAAKVASTTRTAVPWHRTARRVSAQKQKKKDGNTLIFDRMLSSGGE
jgi:hypothetical protein